MKKIIILILSAAILLSGCSLISGTNKPTPTATPEPEPTEIPPLQTEQPEAVPNIPMPEEADLNADPLNVVDKYFYNYNVIMHEDYKQMLSDDMEQFTTKSVGIADDGDGIRITGASNTSKIMLANTLNEYSADNILPEQAVLIRFKTDTETRDFLNTEFCLDKEGAGCSFRFYKNKFPATGQGVFLRNDDGNFELMPNTWCYALMTIDDYSNASILVWHENEFENMSRYFYRSILDDRDQSSVEACLLGQLTFRVQVAPSESFTLSDIWVIEYEVMKR